MFLGGKTIVSFLFGGGRGKPLIFERYHEMIQQHYTLITCLETHFPTKRTRYIAARVTNDIAPIKAVDTKRPTWGPRVCQRKLWLSSGWDMVILGAGSLDMPSYVMVMIRTTWNLLEIFDNAHDNMGWSQNLVWKSWSYLVAHEIPCGRLHEA